MEQLTCQGPWISSTAFFIFLIIPSILGSWVTQNVSWQKEYKDLVHQLKQINERLFDLPKLLESYIRPVTWVQLSGHFPCQYFILEKCNSANGFKHMLEFQGSKKMLKCCCKYIVWHHSTASDLFTQCDRRQIDFVLLPHSWEKT